MAVLLPVFHIFRACIPSIRASVGAKAVPASLHRNVVFSLGLQDLHAAGHCADHAARPCADLVFHPAAIYLIPMISDIAAREPPPSGQ
jgi:hypothetical protein